MSAAELEAELLRSGDLAEEMPPHRPAARTEEIAHAIHPAAAGDAGTAALRAWLNEE
jgi:hypothetical protein